MKKYYITLSLPIQRPGESFCSKRSFWLLAHCQCCWVMLHFPACTVKSFGWPETGHRFQERGVGSKLTPADENAMLGWISPLLYRGLFVVLKWTIPHSVKPETWRNPGFCLCAPSWTKVMSTLISEMKLMTTQDINAAATVVETGVKVLLESKRETHPLVLHRLRALNKTVNWNI